MTPVSIYPHTAEGLKAGKLAIGRATEPPCIVCKSWAQSARDAGICSGPHLLEHLVAIIGSPPTCETCGGSGKVVLQIDHGYTIGTSPYVPGQRIDNHYDHSTYQTTDVCHRCAGSRYPKDITFVVECPSLHSLHHHSDRCPDCGPGTNGYRPVATAQLLQVLPVYRPGAGLLLAQMNAEHVARDSVESMVDHSIRNTMWIRHPDRTITDISHLLPWFGEGVKWAGLVTGLEGL